jgi:hypothetical protein
MKRIRKITAKVGREALPWPGNDVVNAYLTLHPKFKYREQCIQLLLESYHAFLAGCPRASIIVAGEALLRFVYDRIICFVGDGGTIEITRKGKARGQALTLDRETDPWVLDDQLPFCDALQALRRTRLCPSEMIDKAYAVKDLRNCAAHGELPVLSDWDPDEPRNDEEFEKMFSKEDYEFPEAYQFWRRDDPSRAIRLDMRKYAPVTFRSIGWEESFVGIQFLLVIGILKTP